MAHIPHAIFKHILSYKDPRYEKVRSGIRAPPCVFYSWEQRHSAPDGAMILEYSPDFGILFRQKWQNPVDPCPHDPMTSYDAP